MNVFDEINGWSADELLSRINLQRANDEKSWVCPICGNGSCGDPRHGHGDGIKPRNSKGRVRWKCFKCDTDFSNVDLAAATFNIDAEQNPAEAAKRLAAEFGLDNDRAFSSSRKQSSNVVIRDGVQSADDTGEKNSTRHGYKIKGYDDVKGVNPGEDAEPKNYAKFYKFCRSNYSLDKFLAEHGGKWRGLTAETLKRAGALYHAEYIFSEGVKHAAIILPYDDYHYFARSVEDGARGKGGKNAGLYEPEPIGGNKTIIIVEGEIDALSLLQLYGDVFNFFATGSASNADKAVNELEKRFGDAERKPPCIVVFDDDNPNNDPAKDNPGKKHSEELVKWLREKNYPTVSFFFTDGTGAKVDANDLLQRGELDKHFINKLDAVGVELDEQKEKMVQRLETKAREVKALETVRRAENNQSGIAVFPMAEYFSQQFWADVALTAKYANRRTGFDNLDGTGEFDREGQKLFFLPGVYVIGGTPGAGKTTFCWQLINQLAEQGEMCFYCSYEMSRQELYAKTIAADLFKRRQAGESVMTLSAADIRRGAGNGIDEVNCIVDELSKSSARISVLELSNVNIAELIKYLSPIVNASDRPPVIVVDYLQIVPPADRKATAKEKIDDVMLRLKNFQRATNTTLIVISALNRASNQKQEPELDSYRESSSIEYSCDVALALTTLSDKGDDMKKMPRPTKLICRKSRNGGSFDDACFNYYCRFDCFEPCTEKDFGVDDDEPQDRIKGKRVRKQKVASPYD